MQGLSLSPKEWCTLIREELAVRFFALSFEVSASSNSDKGPEAVAQFIALYNSKRQQFADFLTKLTAKTGQEYADHRDASTSLNRDAFEVPLSKQPFVRFLSQNCGAIFLQGSYCGFKCSPKIICCAILRAKSLYTPGSERWAANLLRAIIDSYQHQAFRLDKRDASLLYRVGAQLSLAIGDYATASLRLQFSLLFGKNDAKANIMLLTLRLRNFRFDLCYKQLSKNPQFFRLRTFKAIKLLAAACVDPSRPERHEFIRTMQEDHDCYYDDWGRIYQKYFRFDHCCGYFLYLTLEYRRAYSYFEKCFDLVGDIASIEGMCLCSYRLKDYGRALLELQAMRKIMPQESGWRLLIAAVCCLKLGRKEEAMAKLARVDEGALFREEEILYAGVLYTVGQASKAVAIVSSTMNPQTAIVALLCEQQLGDTARVNQILSLLPYLKDEDQSIDSRFMAFQHALFLANYLFERNRLAEGRRWVGKVRQMGENLNKIVSASAFDKLMEELKEHKHVEVELAFR